MAKVLIVEDNPANMSLAIFLLQSAGHTVLSAVDAEIGLRLARDEQPNLILMDIQLPGMDGLEATVLLKRDAATRAIPVIALTALAMKSDEERIRAAGCDGYIAKPLEYRNFWRPFQLNWSPRGCKARVTGAKMNPSVGVQWELRRAVARRDQSHALGFFLNPAPLTGTLPRQRFRFAESPFPLKDPRVDGSKRRGQGLPGVGDGKAAGEPSRPKCRRMRGFPPFSPPARLVATREPVRGTVKWLRSRSATRTPFSGFGAEIQLVLSPEPPLNAWLVPEYAESPCNCHPTLHSPVCSLDSAASANGSNPAFPDFRASPPQGGRRPSGSAISRRREGSGPW